MIFRLAYLDLTFFPLKVTVAVMHICTLKISYMVTDRTNITIAIVKEVLYGRSVGISALDLVPF